MRSDVDICNVALASVGQSPISSLDESSATARLCRQFYDIKRQLLMSQWDWSFARTTQALSLVSVETPWTYAYGVPSQALTLRQVLGSVTGRVPQPFSIMLVSGAKVVGTNTPDATAVFTANVEAAAEFSPGFAAALSAAIAMDVAPSVTRDAKLVQLLTQKFQYEISNARASSDETLNEPVPDADWIGAR